MKKKIGVLMFQTVAKTGNIGKKKTIDYLLTVLFLKSIFFLYPNNWGLSR